MAAWELTSWLALIRTFQLLGALAGAALNGFVAVMIYIKDHDLLINVVVLELLVWTASLTVFLLNCYRVCIVSRHQRLTSFLFVLI